MDLNCAWCTLGTCNHEPAHGTAAEIPAAFTMVKGTLLCYDCARSKVISWSKLGEAAGPPA